MSNLHHLERGLAAWFDPRAARPRKAPNLRQRLQAKEAKITEAANAAYAAGDKAKGRRLDEAAHRTWRAWQFAR